MATGFPDILFGPVDSLARLRKHQERTGADVVLGLFPAGRPDKVDMVHVEENGQVRQVVIKPASSTLWYTWILAVWTPRFTQFLHDDVRTRRPGPARERYVGDIVQSAIADGWRVEGLSIPQGWYRDIGTPDDFLAAAEDPRG